VLVLCVACLAQDNKGACSFSEPVSYITFNTLVSNIRKESFSRDKLKVLDNFVTNLTLGFNSSQVVILVSLFSFADDRASALNLVSDNVLTLTVDGIVSILNSLTFSSEKIPALQLVINFTNRADLNQSAQKIINAFSFSSDKDTARRIINASAPRSCLFGPADLQRFAFVIDVSGSMSTQFKDVDGQTYTRLQYVQKDLSYVLQNTVKDSQEFNIISFSDSANAWQPGVVKATPANKAAAGVYTKALKPGGGTYMLNALKLAFSDTKVIGVYFLSDGEPSDNAPAVLSFLAKLGKPCNTIAFKASLTAQQFMYQMARVVNGTFRAII